MNESIQDIRRDDYFGKGTFERQVVKNEILSGKGVLNFKDGMYDGDVVNNVPHGKGKFTYYSTSTEYEGDVVQGYFEGQGLLKFGKTGRYEGTFKAHKKEGRGTYYFEDGSVYTGEFHNDLREGKGRMTYSDGESYSGDFKQGLRCGEGKYIFHNGDKYIGSYLNDLREGQGEYIVKATGKKLIGQFKDGYLLESQNSVQFSVEKNSSTSLKDPSKVYENYVKNNTKVSSKDKSRISQTSDTAQVKSSSKLLDSKAAVQIRKIVDSKYKQPTTVVLTDKVPEKPRGVLAKALSTIVKKVDTIVSSTQLMKDMEKQKQINRELQQQLADLKNDEAARVLKYLKKKEEDKKKEDAKSLRAWKPPIAPKYLSNSSSENVSVTASKYVTKAEKEEIAKRNDEIHRKLTAASGAEVKLSKPPIHFSRRDSSKTPSPTRSITTATVTTKPKSKNDSTKKSVEDASKNTVTQVTVSNYEAAAILVMAADLAVSNHERFLKLANDKEYTNLQQVIFENSKDKDNISEETLVIKKQTDVLDARFYMKKDISQESNPESIVDSTSISKPIKKKPVNTSVNISISTKDIIGDSTTTWWNNVMHRKNEIETKILYEI